MYKLFICINSYTLRSIINNGRFRIGHLTASDCYNRQREYSPMVKTLHDEVGPPPALGPYATLQASFAEAGDGVPPEYHPSAWFLLCSGVKRWVMHPPSNNTPPKYMIGPNCTITGELSEDAIIHDQMPGELMWVPDYWWHETCNVGEFASGMGAVTYDGCENVSSGNCQDGDFTSEDVITTSD